MAGVGLLTDDVSAVCCEGFVGSDTSGKDDVNFCVTSFDGFCMDTTGSCLAGIVVGCLRNSVACSVTWFSGLAGTIFFLVKYWCDGSTGEGDEF
jgi:hypothetical protein